MRASGDSAERGALVPGTALALGHSAKSPAPAGSSTSSESMPVQAGCCAENAGSLWQLGKRAKLVFSSLSILCSRVTVPVIGASECQDTGLEKLV